MGSASATQLRVMMLLRQYGSCTAVELAEELSITPSGIRQQIAIMTSEGLVTAIREAGRPGRPLHRYKLTDAAERFFPKTYDALALEILDDLIRRQGREGLKAFLARRAEKIATSYTEVAARHKDTQSKLKVIAQKQTDAGYMASVDTEGQQLLLEEYNCPFIQVARKYPEFCEAERGVYERVLGKKVKLDSCRARGTNVCRFCVEATVDP